MNEWQDRDSVSENTKSKYDKRLFGILSLDNAVKSG